MSSVFETFQWCLKEAFVYPGPFGVSGAVWAGDTEVGGLSFPGERKGTELWD